MMLSVLIIAAIIFLASALAFIVIPETFRSVLSVARNSPPFVPTRRDILRQIIEALDLRENSVLYDLGCGNGRVLRAVAENRPGVRCIGIEHGWFPVMFARWNARKTLIEIRKADIFCTDLADATHVYCYLLPEFMNKIEVHLRERCRPGTRIVSCDFPIPRMVPARTILLSQSRWRTGNRLYVYVLD